MGWKEEGRRLLCFEFEHCPQKFPWERLDKLVVMGGTGTFIWDWAWGSSGGSLGSLWTYPPIDMRTSSSSASSSRCDHSPSAIMCLHYHKAKRRGGSSSPSTFTILSQGKPGFKVTCVGCVLPVTEADWHRNTIHILLRGKRSLEARQVAKIPPTQHAQISPLVSENQCHLLSCLWSFNDFVFILESQA